MIHQRAGRACIGQVVDGLVLLHGGFGLLHLMGEGMDASQQKVRCAARCCVLCVHRVLQIGVCNGVGDTRRFVRIARRKRDGEGGGEADGGNCQMTLERVDDVVGGRLFAAKTGCGEFRVF